MGVDLVDVDALLAEIFHARRHVGSVSPLRRGLTEEQWHERFPVIEPAWGEGRPVYRDSIVLHGLESLPVRVG